MGYYRKKPVVIEAMQWFKNGDHPEDDCKVLARSVDGVILGEGSVVRYYRTPSLDGTEDCQLCDRPMHLHGWIDTLEGGHIVCPGDYIIKGVQGEFYPCKPDIFYQTYEPVEDE